MVGLEGLEPPTLSLGNSCSIHLSYSPMVWEGDYTPARPESLARRAGLGPVVSTG
jgi:hypothetical protein